MSVSAGQRVQVSIKANSTKPHVTTPPVKGDAVSGPHGRGWTGSGKGDINRGDIAAATPLNLIIQADTATGASLASTYESS